jgi:hypothetical protein
MTVYICREELEEIVRRTDGKPRWCFHCRTRREFLYVVQAPVGLSYYGPTPHVECATCGTYDGDCFPGTEREWGDQQ